MRTPLAIVAAVALGAGVTACGEKDEPEPQAPQAEAGATGEAGSGDEGPGDAQRTGEPEGVSTQDSIRRTVQTVLGGGPAAEVCGELVTTRYLNRAYGDASGCRAAVAEQGRFDVEVASIEVDGDSASARAVPGGGPNRGETIRVKLVEEGGEWKVDSALSNAPAGP